MIVTHILASESIIILVNAKANTPLCTITGSLSRYTFKTHFKKAALGWPHSDQPQQASA